MIGGVRLGELSEDDSRNDELAYMHLDIMNRFLSIIDSKIKNFRTSIKYK